MMKSVTRFATFALVFWAMGTAPSWAKSYLVVQVRSECKPMRDFHTVVVTVRTLSGRAVKRVNTPAYTTRDWRRGVRVAEIELDEGDYRIVIGARHRTKGMIMERRGRVAMDRPLRVITVLLTCPEPEPRTGRGSAPGDPPPLPQLKRPRPKSPSSLPRGALQPNLSDVKSKRCHNSVQGRLAWNYGSNKNWSQANITKLCKGAENSTEPARCFQKIMHGNVSHGTNTRWRWQDALELCAGALNHKRRVQCFQEQIRRGVGQRSAIFRCKNK